MTSVAPTVEGAAGDGGRRIPATVMASIAALGFAIALGAPLENGAEVAAWLAMGVMLVAAAEDLRTRRLRNVLVGPALVFALAADPSWATVGAAVITMTPFLMFALWKPGSIGMGDVKFAAPAGALVGFADVGFLLVVIALLGGVLSVIAFARFGRSGTLAYGPAIALGTFFVAFIAN